MHINTTVGSATMLLKKNTTISKKFKPHTAEV
jgi:hypothetical protein